MKLLLEQARELNILLVFELHVLFFCFLWVFLLWSSLVFDHNFNFLLWSWLRVGVGVVAGVLYCLRFNLRLKFLSLKKTSEGCCGIVRAELL